MRPNRLGVRWPPDTPNVRVLTQGSATPDRAPREHPDHAGTVRESAIGWVRTMGRSLLDDLDGVDRRDLLSSARRRRFRRGEVLWHEGDPGEALHVIVKGYVAVRTSTRLGDTVTLAVLGPGEPIGINALFNLEAMRSASCVALDAVETLSWTRDQVDYLRSQSRDVDRFLIEVLVDQVQRLTGQLLEATHETVETRVIRNLAALAELFDPDAEVATVPVTQDDLATMAGTTRPTANRMLKELETDGVIALARGRIEVLDRAALAKRARR